jgi:hypothetical protein
MTHSSDQRGVDDLRERLKALGYLDAGVNRFVLAPARGGRSAPAIALRSSARIGLLAALLLGPSAAVGLGLRMPGLVTGPRDAIVIALYLAVVFGVVVAAAAFAAAEVARRATTHAWRAARITGVTLGALCLVYLTLWWRTANAGFGWSAPAWTAFALAVAVAISLLLGHAVSITTLALIARASDGAALEPRARRSFWRLTAPLGLVAFLGAGVLLLSTTPERADAEAAPDFAVVPTGAAVTVVAIDGFDTALARQLVEGGALPHLAVLARAARAQLAPQTSTDPAPVWTTIATGQPPSVHGVTGLETRRVAGVQGAVAASRSPLVEALAAATDLVRLTRPAVASADQRREKTFWEVAAGKGLRTAVVNWWATWPAPKGAGIVVTDRAPIRLERGGTLDAEIAPPALYDTFHAAWPAMRAQARARAREAFGAVADAGAREVLARSAELDTLVVEMATSQALGPLDLLVVYLPGLDIAQHTLLAGPGSSALPPSSLAGRVDALEAYYRFLDGLVAPLVDRAATPRALVALVTAPGRVAGGGPGLFALAGDGAHEPAPALEARAVDVAPTLLYALGLPASRALAGRPVLGLFAPAFVGAHPLREVATYGPRVAPDEPRRGQALDKETIERLRSLGYVR